MKVKAILIDAKNATVKLVELEDRDSLDEMYKLIDCKTIEAIRPRELRGSDALYVDEEGLLHDPPLPHWFQLPSYPQVLAGNGLICGTDEEGYLADVKTPLASIAKSIEFLRGGDL